MTVLDRVKKSFANCEIGEEFCTQEIIAKVNTEFGVNRGSIIPSDYCYNITNNGIYDFLSYLHIFEQVKRGKYRYLGENYLYSGKVDNKGKPIGEWVNGKYYSFSGNSPKQQNHNKNVNGELRDKPSVNIKKNIDSNTDKRKEFLRISYVHGNSIDEIIRNSIKRAYRDFCRTIRGFGTADNKAEIKSRAEYFLYSELYTFLTSGFSNFSVWHKDLMQRLIKVFFNQPFTIGQAQKWINMSFKYLYCFTDYTLPGITIKHFEQCHTPIDNYVMANASKWYGIKTLPIAWSRLDDYDLYINYQRDLKSIADSKGITQLELDFELWQP